jgi:hypothetical protein
MGMLLILRTKNFKTVVPIELKGFETTQPVDERSGLPRPCKTAILVRIQYPFSPTPYSEKDIISRLKGAYCDAYEYDMAGICMRSLIDHP